MKFIDLFSGIGGFRVALESLGQQCVFSADFDKYACDSYQKNFGDYPLIDLTQYDEKKVPDHDILCGGFPCQPFSIGGFRKGFEDARGTLFFDTLRILKEKKPKAFILENVRGLVSHDEGKTFKHMLNFLAAKINGEDNPNKYKYNLGYNVYWKFLNSKNFGLPQNRDRVFIVGFKDKNIKFTFPTGSSEKHKTLIDVLDKKPEIKKMSKLAQGHIQRHLKNHQHYNLLKDLDYLVAYEVRNCRVTFRFNNSAPCLTTKMGTGGNNVPYLVKQNRYITIREFLKIQGFPNNFKLTDSYANSLKQIGNSVSVPVVRAVANEVIKVLT